jgi:nitroreductase/NAD-dependent dihydropyrimidine dehydrogenase PreA subunit
MPIIKVDPELCTFCGACLQLCTGEVYGESSGRASALAPEECWLCGHCVAACPADAIRHSEYPFDGCPPLDLDVLPSLDGLVTAFRERRSARVFRDEPVPRDLIRELVDIARWVPSASNEQPVDWLAFDDPERIAVLSSLAVHALAVETLTTDPETAGEFSSLAQARAKGQDPIFFRAPVVLVAHVPTGDDFGRDDAVYAAYNLMLAAQRRGLGTCQIGYFHLALDRGNELHHALGLPKDRRPEVTLVLGYPAFEFHRLLPRRRPKIMWNNP